MAGWSDQGERGGRPPRPGRPRIGWPTSTTVTPPTSPPTPSVEPDSASDAADVVAETFLVVWRRNEVVPDGPDTLPWLYGVARRVLANQRRTHRRRGRLRDRLVNEFERVDLDPTAIEELEEFRRVAAALRRLSDDDAELLRLTAWEGLSPTEIATATGLAPGTVRQRLRRARQRLRKLLADEEAKGNGDHCVPPAAPSLAPRPSPAPLRAGPGRGERVVRSGRGSTSDE